MIERIIRKFISFGFRKLEKMPLFSRAKQASKQTNKPEVFETPTQKELCKDKYYCFRSKTKSIPNF